jgi:hypothetical protein
LVDAIMTCCPIFARAACAIVNVALALLTGKTGKAAAKMGQHVMMASTNTHALASMGFQEPIAKLMSTVVLLRRVKTVQHA